MYESQIRSLYLVFFFILGSQQSIHMLLMVIYIQPCFEYWQLFFPSSFFLEWILSVFIDYYILENNSLLKAALKYKRIQLTDFRTVPTEHFGEKKESLSICTLSAENL